ncbi:MAG: SDR family oxidoreductase [Alphaproteobacteria bacterium]
MVDLTDAVIMVTGGASGIGASCVSEFTQRGARVAILDIAEEPGRRVAFSQPGGRGFFVKLDVASQTGWNEAFGAVESQWGQVNGLVNCAAIASPEDDLDTVDEALWNRILEINLTGTMLGCQAFVLRADPKDTGAIVNFSSIQGQVGVGDALAYAASKIGVHMLTKSIAQHCMSRGYRIRCNCISPGYIDTPMVTVSAMSNESTAKEHREALGARNLMRRLGAPEELAKTVAFLLSNDADFVNGSDYTVDGGYTAV